MAKEQMYQYKAPVADFTRALAVDSLYADALEYRGISYASYDRSKEARKDLEKAAELNLRGGEEPVALRQRQQHSAEVRK